MRHQRLFFIVVIGALLVVLAILGLVVLVNGDEADQSRSVEPSPAPLAGTGLGGSTRAPGPVVAAPR